MQVAIFDSWRALEIQRKLNDHDLHTISFEGRDDRIPLFELDGFVEVMRQVPGSAWYQEYVGFHRTGQYQYTEADNDIFTSYGRGLADLLGRRIIAYKSATAYALKSGPGDNIMKEFVNQNAAVLATSPPRIADGVFPNLTIEGNYSLGLTWAGHKPYQNLLAVLQEISLTSNVDFRVALIGGLSLSGTLAFQFQTAYPQLGTDRSTTVQFSLQHGNMLSPSVTVSRTEEVTRIFVLGPGEENNRRVVVRSSADTADSPWNLIEATYDARREETLAAMNNAGDARLEELLAQDNFTFEVLQTDSLQYGRDYFVGDLVTASFKAVTAVLKIIGATISVSEGRETINMDFAIVPTI